jgi:uncharacterized linocin/CFP29 family protein
MSEMDYTLRGLAPIADDVWAHLAAEARRVLESQLAGRRILDFEGPLGPKVSAVNTGRMEPVSTTLGTDAVTVHLRTSQPMARLRATFELPREELEAMARFAEGPDLASLERAARALALAEDTLVFLGNPELSVPGLCNGSSHPPLHLGKDRLKDPQAVVDALYILESNGVGGPYALVLDSHAFQGVRKTLHPGGLTVFDLISRFVSGPVLHSQALDGGVLVSMRGGDHRLICGEDATLVYLSHDGESVRLALEETLTVVVSDPAAAVWIQARD